MIRVMVRRGSSGSWTVHGAILAEQGPEKGWHFPGNIRVKPQGEDGVETAGSERPVWLTV